MHGHSFGQVLMKCRHEHLYDYGEGRRYLTTFIPCIRCTTPAMKSSYFYPGAGLSLYLHMSGLVL